MSTEPTRASVDLTALAWHTSSYSGGGSGGCVEHAPMPATGAHAVRDTKDRARGHVRFPDDTWGTFVTAVRNDTLPRR